jgi:hypothetical protein
LEESDFLNEICLTALSTSKSVTFAAVVDIKGKLIAGKYRNGSKRSKTSLNAINYCYYHPSSLFYSAHLVRAIQKSYFERRYAKKEVGKEVHFQLIDIYENNVKLAIAPLTQSRDKYLCVFFESSHVESYRQIIMKINNTLS